MGAAMRRSRATASPPLMLSKKVGTTYCWSWPNSTGEVGVIFASGSDSAQANDLRLTALRLPPDKVGYFINSPAQGFTAFPGGSQGNLCLSPPIGRHASQVTGTGLGFLDVQIDLTQLPTPSGNHSVVAGETWNWQLWYRDFNQNPTSNFTFAASPALTKP